MNNSSYLNGKKRMITTEQQTKIQRNVAYLFAQNPDWITFYREILGPRGIVRQLFPTREALAAFEQSDTFDEILNMLTRLRERVSSEEEEAEAAKKEKKGKEKEKKKENPEEPTKVITVRLPKSLHESLFLEAHDRRTSMNKLCISKLLQFIDSDKVPAEKQI